MLLLHTLVKAELPSFRLMVSPLGFRFTGSSKPWGPMFLLFQFRLESNPRWGRVPGNFQNSVSISVLSGVPDYPEGWNLTSHLSLQFSTDSAKLRTVLANKC